MHHAGALAMSTPQRDPLFAPDHFHNLVRSLAHGEARFVDGPQGCVLSSNAIHNDDFVHVDMDDVLRIVDIQTDKRCHRGIFLLPR
jgi:hypothetical protein